MVTTGGITVPIAIPFFEELLEGVTIYNLFMFEENDYEDDDDRFQDPAIVLKQQKYKTWLYVVLLAEWIEGLNIENATHYETWDFRKVAYSQFELLSRLCLLSREIISQIQTDINNTDFLTINLLPKIAIQLEIDGTIESQKNDAFGRMISFFNYWKITIKRNNLISALGTNYLMVVDYSSDVPEIYGVSASYISTTPFVLDACDVSSSGNDPINAAILSPQPMNLSDVVVQIFAEPRPDSTIVNGFFVACTVFDALLASTLDCLYESECIQLLENYFPNLEQTNFNWNNSILSSKQDNNSIGDYLQTFFTSNWSTNMNYSSYFDQCSPSICTYTTIEKTNLAYTITLFISLYGGLIIILRLIASWVISIWFKITNYSNEISIYENINMFKPIESMKKLNLFKNINDKTENSIKQQRIITRIYLILLLALRNSSVLNENDFNQQLYTDINQFYQSTIYNFDLMKDITQIIRQVDQFHEQLLSANTLFPDPVLTLNMTQIKFILYGIQDINTGLTKCICAIDPYCQRPVVLTDAAAINQKNNNSNFIHNIPGWIQGCLATDSVLFSTFSCLYIDSDCFSLFLSYVRKNNYDVLALPLSSTSLQPLVYDPTMSHYPPNTLISTIIQEIMLEKWNPISSYKQFYDSCAPIYCSYSENIRKQTFLGLITIFVSMIGGIVVSLRLITPHLVKFFLESLKKFNNKSEQTQQVQHSLSNRLKMMIQNIIKMLYETLIDLNIFVSRDFASDLDRMTVKRYGQWATRLYFILFISSLTILILYTIIKPQILTKKFNEPSFTYYNQLKDKYNDELKCSCSRIASTYNQFVSIQPIFHSICSSQFISEEWRHSLINGLVSNLSIYEQRDYRRFLSSHLQYLQGLCRLSIQTVNKSINEFLTSLLVTNELLTENNFNNRLNLLITQSKSNAPDFFSNLVFYIQSMIHGNAFVTTYGTNFEYVIMIDENEIFYAVAPGEPIIYDDNCSCKFFPNCTTQAVFFKTNSSTEIPVKGLKMGCTPSESFLASTLECFYNQSCLNLIQQYTNYNSSLISLSNTTSQYLQNTTIDELRLNLFIEKWITKLNYPSYYQQCLPSICSYISIEKFNILYTITLILGLQGGLTIVLKWICPKLVRIGLKIYYRRKHRMILPNLTTNRNWNYENRSTNVILQ
ncbi:hypothetical protein I4U23_022425 [Adineta vaga]|nr:hypothetical protein I4U23_022425 [Adineta vaga]